MHGRTAAQCSETAASQKPVPLIHEERSASSRTLCPKAKMRIRMHRTTPPRSTTNCLHFSVFEKWRQFTMREGGVCFQAPKDTRGAQSALQSPTSANSHSVKQIGKSICARSNSRNAIRREKLLLGPRRLLHGLEMAYLPPTA